MSILLINPNLVVQRSDVFTTGIIYLPISLAYTAAALRQHGYEVNVVDAFGEAPKQPKHLDKFISLGLSDSEILARVPENTRYIFVYAINLTNYLATVNIVRLLKQNKPNIPVIVIENTQAVTSFSLSLVADEFYKEGGDYVLTGEGEERSHKLIELLEEGAVDEQLKQIDGLGSPLFYNPPSHFLGTKELDALPFPAWDLFPLENYWGLRFAHGPMHTDRYLAMLTSRGCPYRCGFCVVPATNQAKWRYRSAKNVVDEMEYFLNTLGVTEYHIEDLDPTISDARTREICEEIIQRGLRISWKLVAGTKIETIRNAKTLELMADAGCSYVSFSPETGSPRLLKSMNKPFDLKHAIQMVKSMSDVGIYSQACFILGYPGELDEDRKQTLQMVKDLTREGVDEIAVFIITPVPGSSIFSEFHEDVENLSELNFSPTWRSDYQELNNFRLRLYITFLLWKLWHHPPKVIRQPFNFLRRRFQTKMEMVPYRALVWKRLMRNE